jgi:D-alanyl-lipoteichoic acid acyltransferase DltB (MBOAT superfamily)
MHTTSGRYSRLWLVSIIFISVWHDIQLRMLYWGWLIAMLMIPELISIRLLCTPKVYFIRIKIRKLLGPWHLHLCAFGSVLNILMLMVANLIGFSVGVDGISEMITKLFRGEGIIFLE